MTKRRVLLGLIGANIMESLAPALYADALAAAELDGDYHLMDVDRLPERRLAALLGAVKSAGFTGINVTFPFKRDILTLLDAVDSKAAQIGAVNTVTIAPDGNTAGFNTDCVGFRRSFEEGIRRDSAMGATVVLIGAGGAGRAVAHAFMEMGAAALVVHDCDDERAVGLVTELASQYGTSRCRLADDLERDIALADGVVNATPVGMRGFPGNPVPICALTANHWAVDIIYTPIETAFITAAAARGCRVLTGGAMCVHQAAEAFLRFTGVTVDILRLHRTFAAALAARH